MRLPHWIVQGIFSFSCRCALRVAAALVPRELRDEWQVDWTGPLWRWTLDAAASGAPDARWALLIHTRDAVRAAAFARFHSDPGVEQLRDWYGNPKLCLVLGVLAVLSVGIASRGFSVTRQLAGGLSYRDPHAVVVLAQGPPVFGMRLGFSAAETNVFREKSKTLAGVAAYSWHTAAVVVDGRPRLVQSANVEAPFFEVLGVRSPVERLADNEFLVSEEFWRKELHGDPNRVGQTLSVNGRPMRLAGVLPRGFSFLSAPTSIWTSQPEPTFAVPPRRWTVNLRGAVARLNPGVTTTAARKELRDLQTHYSLARRDFQMQATPIEDLVYGSPRSYAADLAILLGGLLAWAMLRFVLDVRGGAPAKRARRFWGFFALKTALPLIALVFGIFELTSAHELGLTGGASARGGPLLVWSYFACAFLVFLWAFRDQPRRCRVCLRRMRQPMRIGVPGQMLLETAGQEVLCPHGHGSVYTSASVLGSDVSDRWMGFDLEIDDAEAPEPGRILPRM